MTSVDTIQEDRRDTIVHVKGVWSPSLMERLLLLRRDHVVEYIVFDHEVYEDRARVMEYPSGVEVPRGKEVARIRDAMLAHEENRDRAEAVENARMLIEKAAAKRARVV